MKCHRSSTRRPHVKEGIAMKLMRTEDAVGQILCHDITRIVKDGEKGPVFRKGHVIREEDIEVLLAVGKDHIYIWENNENMMHENDAAMVLCGLCRNEFMHPTEIKEGKTELIADIDGLLKVDSGKLQRINSQGQMMIATRHGNTVVRAGDRLAGMRVIPLVIEKEKMEAAKRAVPDGKILALLPFVHKKVGIITTGNEILSHRIEDTFTPVVLHKLAAFDCEIVGQYMTGDQRHECRPGRPDAAGDPRGGGQRKCHYVRRTGSAGRNVYARVLSGKPAYPDCRAARVCHVCAKDDL